MAPGTEAVFTAALALPPDNRAALAEKLLESLEGEEQRQIDTACVEEAERRLQAFDQGALRAIPAEEVFRSLQLHPWI